MSPTRITKAVLCILLSAGLSGCPAALVAGAAGGAVVANDERTTGSLLEDEVIELKTRKHIAEKIGKNANISVTSYNRRLLLTGQAPSEEVRSEVLDIARVIPNVRGIINQIEIGNPSSLTSRAADAGLTVKVKVELCNIQRENFSCLDVKVVTEQGVVYLLGLVDRETASIAIQTVRKVPGVIRVVRNFEYR